MRKIPNQAMLITYPDSLGGNLKALREVMDTSLRGAAGSIHILPFFPSSGDRGFSPVTYDLVDPAFGDWQDIAALARDHTLMCDMMVNHISRQSAEFQDFLQKGDNSPYAKMFFDYEAFFGGEPGPEELARLYRRSDRPLYQEIALPDGTVRKLWRSFSDEQIDLDTDQPVTRDYIMRNLAQLGERGISIVRMDAYGYITKVRGTNCFFVEPQIWDLISAMEDMLSQRNMTLLPEVHDRYEIALKISRHGYYTYDFVLPMLVLHTLFTGSGRELRRWLEICPRNQFTVLDTHDGVGVYDADGILSPEQEQAVIRRTEPRLSYSYKPMDMSKAKYRSYQLYATYYSMLDEDDEAYALARAIQLFAPGIPQVYYNGLLCAVNDLSFDPADPRSINRPNYTVNEVHDAVQKPLVQRILAMLRLRNTHPAFDGELVIGQTPDDRLTLTREYKGERVCLDADLRTHRFEIRYTVNGQTRIL